MKCVVNKYGSKISKSGNRIVIESKDGVFESSIENIEQVLICAPSSITTEFLELSVKNNVDVVLLNKYGKPVGRFFGNGIEKTALKRKQLKLTENWAGISIIKEFLSEKIENQIEHLNNISKENISEGSLSKSISKINKSKNMLLEIKGENIAEIRDQIQGLEGSVSKIYFRVLSKSLPKKYQFNGRSRKPAKDYFNCMLNYGYGMLYSEIEKICIISGIDPTIGILHTDGQNRKSFVFDYIEKYRNIIDKIVYESFLNETIKENFFKEVERGYLLDEEGRKHIISKFNGYLNMKVKKYGKTYTMADVMQKDAYKLSERILRS
ncbi:CRISPR-associated protein Cas1 [Methanococcus vannielii SB]|uniref:CRISPR-associated endonuclease Cas1 n=1 Tax=Methanococcus vannielii (strain ATCC 35089 / DSM 1224 / JCM 13029 / OCM 148 / SB) TaxID=406327 RepID=A6UNF5_METVS|nr:CRISPR-associated endonuclease Cas1 [Methanococcus vannielii]ABR54027.1 CRISPR-associated protein Cas1 [Methanococcus vannielii SB]